MRTTGGIPLLQSYGVKSCRNDYGQYGESSRPRRVMRPAIFGATGGTGNLLVEQALDSDREVVALVRDPAKLTTTHERLTILVGEIADSAAVGRAVAGAEAVISALGPRANANGKPITLGTRNILAAMKKHAVQRIIISSTPSATDPDDAPGLRLKLAVDLIRLVARPAYEDIVSTARAVRESDRDWTIVRASMLSNAR